MKKRGIKGEESPKGGDLLEERKKKKTRKKRMCIVHYWV